MLKERLAELDAECDAEVADLEASLRAAQLQAREKFRAKAEDERVKSERRVQERADALMQLVEPRGAEGKRGVVGGGGGGGRSAFAGAAAGGQQGGGGHGGAAGGGGERFSGLRAKAASSTARVVRGRGGRDSDDDL